MAPTLEPGDHVLVNKLAYRTGDPHAATWRWSRRRGPVSCCSSGSSVSAATRSRSATASCTSTGARRASPTSTTTRATAYFGPVEVPAGRLFVLGDNRANSDDSRQLGPVAEDDAIGRVDLRVRPL